MKNKMIKLLAVISAAVCLVASSISVFAAPYIENGPLTEEEAQNYAAQTQMEVLLTYMLDSGMGEAMRDQFSQSQDYYYEKMAEQLEECKDDLGGFVQVNSVDGSIEDYVLTLNYDIQCEKMDAEIISTYKLEFVRDSSTGQLGTSMTPLDITVNPDYPMALNMAEAGRNTIIGLVVVFVVLAFLAFVIGLLKYLNPEMRKKHHLTDDSAAEQNAAKEASVKETQEIPVQNTSSYDEEIVAVMAAAIAMAESEKSADDNNTYYVSSVRRVSGTKRWKRA